jgi:hypothetical protein
MSRLCFLQQIRPFVRPFPPVGAVAAPSGSPAVPHLHRYIWVRKTARHPSRCLRFPLASGTSAGEEAMRSSPRSLGNPCGNMPRASDSGDPGSTSHYRSSEFCLPPGQERRHRNEKRFRSWIFAACFLAVYASHPPVARRMATLATGLFAKLWPGGNITRWISLRSFTVSSSVPPLPSFT